MVAVKEMYDPWEEGIDDAIFAHYDWYLDAPQPPPTFNYNLAAWNVDFDFPANPVHQLEIQDRDDFQDIFCPEMAKNFYPPLIFSGRFQLESDAIDNYKYEWENYMEFAIQTYIVYINEKMQTTADVVYDGNPPMFITSGELLRIFDINKHTAEYMKEMYEEIVLNPDETMTLDANEENYVKWLGLHNYLKKVGRCDEENAPPSMILSSNRNKFWV